MPETNEPVSGTRVPLPPLAPEDRAWVEEAMTSMTLEEHVGNVMQPFERYTLEEWEAFGRVAPIGTVFAGDATLEKSLDVIRALQERARRPILVAGDFESGLPTGTRFPTNMACAATGEPELIRRRGRAIAREARAQGLHWTFSPVCDLNLHFQNPETNVRSYGDETETVLRCAVAFLQGVQEENRLAATAKHFPGAGQDDRDQHATGSTNTLPMDAWRASYGRILRAAIEAGVMSVMCGHISLPAWEGLEETPARAMPATLNARLQNDLLRGELGFDGLVVSDAAPMIGMTSRIDPEEQGAENLRTGSDVYLHGEPEEDYRRLTEAARGGALSEERLRDASRRVVELKARLGLHRDLYDAPLSGSEREEHASLAQTIAEKGITLQRDNGVFPVRLGAGARVLAVTLRWKEARDVLAPPLPVVSEELRARGFRVDAVENPTHYELIEKADDYDFIFFNYVILPHGLMGTLRMVGHMVMAHWRSWWRGRSNIVFTSFGSPYVLYEQPHLPNMVLAYGACEASQRAAVRAWFGEIPMDGRCPVKMPAATRL